MLDKVTEKNRCDLHSLRNNEEDGGEGEDVQSSVEPKSYTVISSQIKTDISRVLVKYLQSVWSSVATKEM